MIRTTRHALRFSEFDSWHCLTAYKIKVRGTETMEIQNKTFLISGGASGLGAATARLLAGLGANVIIADLKAETGESLVAELGASARFVQTDVSSEDSVQNAV